MLKTPNYGQVLSSTFLRFNFSMEPRVYLRPDIFPRYQSSTLQLSFVDSTWRIVFSGGARAPAKTWRAETKEERERRPENRVVKRTTRAASFSERVSFVDPCTVSWRSLGCTHTHAASSPARHGRRSRFYRAIKQSQGVP